MSRIRRLLLLLALLGPVSAGCAAADGTGDTGATGAAPVTVTDDLGEVTLDREPARIVTTSDETTELVVALGLRPVGVGSTRVNGAASDDTRFADYYLSPEQLGEPRFVGGQTDLEAVVGLRPDLIVHGSEDDLLPKLRKAGPTLVYDVEAPGAWQRALTELGRATGRTAEAARVIADYRAQVETAKKQLAPAARSTRRVTVLYPQYRGGSDNFVFDERFALVSVLPELGFDLVGLEKAGAFQPGVGTLSAERYGLIDTDVILALGPADWRRTSSGPVLSALDVPVRWVRVDPGRPSTGPLSAPHYLREYTEVLLARR